MRDYLMEQEFIDHFEEGVYHAVSLSFIPGTTNMKAHYEIDYARWEKGVITRKAMGTGLKSKWAYRRYLSVRDKLERRHRPIDRLHGE